MSSADGIMGPMQGLFFHDRRPTGALSIGNDLANVHLLMEKHRISTDSNVNGSTIVDNETFLRRISYISSGHFEQVS